MANDYTNKIKQITVGGTNYWLSACKLLDKDGGEHSYEDITALIAQGLEIKVVTTLPTASKDTMGKLYLIADTTSKTGSYVEYVTVKTGSAEPYTYSWERIGTTEADLSDYAKKTEAGKADTYTSSAASATNSGEEAAYNATVTISGIKYDKANASTGNNTTISTPGTTDEGGGATVSGSNFTFTGKTKNVGVSVTKVTAGSVTAHSYTPKGDVTVSHDATKDTTATVLKAVSAPASAVNISTTAAATKGVKVSTTAAGTASVGIEGGTSSGTNKFNTDAIKDFSLSASSTSTDGPAYVESVSYTKQALSGTTSFNTNGIKSASLDVKDTATTGYQAVVTNVTGGSASGTFLTGIKTAGSASLSGGVYGFSSLQTGIMMKAVVTNGVLSWSSADTSEATVSHSDPTFNTGSVSYTAPTPTIKYFKVATVAADNGTVGITDGAVTPTTKYMKHTNTAASKSDAVTGVTPAALTGTTTFVTAAIASAALAEDTSSTAAFKFNTDAIKSATCSQSFVTSVTANGTANAITAIGGLSGEFEGTADTLEHSVTDPTFTGSFANADVEGTIGGSQTIDAHTHGYDKPVAHTHSVGTTPTSVTGSATAAILKHSHTITHTHTTTVSAISA